MISFRYAITTDAEALLTVRRAAVLNSGEDHYTPEELEAWAPDVNNESIEAEAEALKNPDRITIVAVDNCAGQDYSLNSEGIDLCVNSAESTGPSVIIGLCTIGIEEGLLKQCYVLPEYRGEGVAAGLVRQAEITASDRGLKSLKLSSSLIALGFYKKMGYTAQESYHYDLGNGLTMECVMMSKEI